MSFLLPYICNTMSIILNMCTKNNFGFSDLDLCTGPYIYGPPKLTATSFVNTFLSDRLCNMGKFLVEYSTTMQIIC